ncbi:MAG: helix-turn-helix domain-containing protein [Chitinivibrionales bacterium]|nr:helix-turn-helix domain-containing protein [Chitinivibrionales bacterium]
MENYVDVKKVSEYLGICEMTIYSWRYKGIIPSYKVGGKVAFRLSEIEKFMQSNKAPLVGRRT